MMITTNKHHYMEVAKMNRNRARFTANGNTKLGKTMGVYSQLMGDDNYWIPELQMYVRGTCGKHCAGCKGNCYVLKSYLRYTARDTGKCSVKLGHARNTIAYRENAENWFTDLHNQLSRKRKPFETIRLNQSGEIEDALQFALFCRLAAWHTESKFYIYTKNYDVVIPALLSGNVPENLTVLISIWHEYGIEENKKVAHLENVKAFVYVDYNKDAENGWNLSDYAERGIIITTMCKAYDERGKMNHEITCDKCKKCFNRGKCHKVIGCLAH